MTRLFSLAVKIVARLMYWISGAAVVGIVFLTVFDVVMRKFGAPVDFAFEVVCALAGIVIAFALPQTSLDHGHVAVEFLDAKLSKGRLKVVHIATRWIGIVMFVIIGGNAFRLGARLARAGQHSAILEIPDFPFAYALGVGCLVEALVLFHMVLRETGEPRS